MTRYFVLCALLLVGMLGRVPALHARDGFNCDQRCISPRGKKMP